MAALTHTSVTFGFNFAEWEAAETRHSPLFSV